VPEYLRKSFPIARIEKTDDGDFHVLGRASDGGIDHDRQRVSPAWMKSAVQDWLASGGNLRVSHNPSLYPAGRGVEAWTDDDGSTWVKSVVVERTAKDLVRKKCLTAYSVGISWPKIEYTDKSAPGGVIVSGVLSELSLVDRPSNPRAGIVICKSMGGTPAYIGRVFEVSGIDRKINKQMAKAERAMKRADELIAARDGVSKSYQGPDSITAMFLNSSNPAIALMAEEALRVP
jgi:hypothetical protein